MGLDEGVVRKQRQWPWAVSTAAQYRLSAENSGISRLYLFCPASHWPGSTHFRDPSKRVSVSQAFGYPKLAHVPYCLFPLIIEYISKPSIIQNKPRCLLRVESIWCWLWFSCLDFGSALVIYFPGPLRCWNPGACVSQARLLEEFLHWAACPFETLVILSSTQGASLTLFFCHSPICI